MDAPQRSDICLSIRSVTAKPTPNAFDPQGMKTLDQALAMIAEVRPDRLEWSYTWKNPEFGEPLRKACPRFVPAINTISPPGHATDFEGEPCIAPWMVKFGRPDLRTPYICMNNPEDTASRVEQVTSVIAAGYDTAVQHDDWLGNIQMERWCSWSRGYGMKACFCEFCLAAFREYLGLELDYRRYLRQRGIETVHELATACRAGTVPLWDDYVRFQMLTVRRYLRTIRNAIGRASGEAPVFAVNWTAGEKYDDLLRDNVEYLNGETPDFSPATLYKIAKAAEALNILQIVTLVPDVPAEEYHAPAFILRVRRAIATAYALGLIAQFPFDVYAGNKPRWFGRWEEYAREYDFVREHREWFNGYSVESFSDDEGTVHIQTAPVGETGRPRLCHRIHPDGTWQVDVH